MAKFPMFCNEVKDAGDEDSLVNACKIELATLLAHIKYESQDLTLAEDVECAGSKEWRCKYDDW